jgi:hypothetical protein
MLFSIFLLISIATSFSRKAYDKDRNRYLWAAIGILSFFIMQAVAGIIIGLVYPELLEQNGWMMAISYASGFAGIGTAWYILNKLPDPQAADNSLLDANL